MPRIRELYAFVTDSKAGKLLELNPSENAGVDHLDKHANGDVYGRKVMPYLRRMSPETDIFYLGGGCGSYSICSAWEEFTQFCGGPDWKGVIFPGFLRTPIPLDHSVVLLNESLPGVHIVNAVPRYNTMFLNKGILRIVAEDSGVQEIMPGRNYAVPEGKLSIRALSYNIMQDFAGQDQIVIKPINAYQGSGVLVADRKDLPVMLPYLLHDIYRTKDKQPARVDAFAESYWKENRVSAFQVQPYLQAAPTAYKGREWDATARILWTATILGEESEEPIIDIKAHGGFQKLPRKPVNGHISQEAAISFSYGHGLEKLSHPFRRALTGSGGRVIMTEAELENEATPIRAGLETIFAHMNATTDSAFYQALAESSDPVRRAVADTVRGRFGERPMPRLRRLRDYDEVSDYGEASKGMPGTPNFIGPLPEHV